MFDQKGLITVEKEGLSEDDALAMAIDAGAEDMETEDDVYEIYTAPADVFEVSQRLAQAGAKIQNAELTQVPKTTVVLEGEDAAKMLRLLEALEDHDDVSKVHSNFDMSDETMASIPE